MAGGGLFVATMSAGVSGRYVNAGPAEEDAGEHQFLAPKGIAHGGGCDG